MKAQVPVPARAGSGTVFVFGRVAGLRQGRIDGIIGRLGSRG